MAEEDSDLRLLNDFVGQDEVRAKRAFDKISPRIKAFIKAYLTSFQLGADLKEDVVGTALSRLWSNRQKIEIRRLSEWWQYVRTAARNAAIDMLPREQAMEIFDDLLPQEMADINAEIEALSRSKQLYKAANQLWLGCHDNEQKILRRLLIMQLFYLDGKDWTQVANAAGIAERTHLDSILESKESLSVFAYAELYESGERLVDHIKREWPDCESHVIPIVRLRYLYGFSHQKIAQLLGHQDLSIVEATLILSLQKLPFCTRMERILELMHPQKAILKEQGICKRLCFQYAMSPAQSYPQNLIWELVGPPSEIAGCKFNPGILNMWLSGGRLLKELKAFMGVEEESEA